MQVLSNTTALINLFLLGFNIANLFPNIVCMLE